MRREITSPGIPCEETNECEPAVEKTAETVTPSTSKDHVASPAKLQPLRVSDELVTGRKSTTFWRAPSPAPAALDCSDGSADHAGFRRRSEDSATDADCLVCFNRYSCSRLPKVLTCQHVFCAICLKLILRREDNTWRIACPVCRKVTAVFGGLICTLPNKEGIKHLADPGPDDELPFHPDAPSGTLAVRSTFSIRQGEGRSSRVATKRLVFLLLLLVILIIFTLPFLYGGLMKWVLYFAITLGLIGAGVLCCNPNCSCSNTSPPFEQTSVSDITSAAQIGPGTGTL